MADPGQSVSVRLHSAQPILEILGVRYYDAQAVITSGLVNGVVHLGFDSTDLAERGRLLDAVEEAEQQGDFEEPFTADWPQDGRSGRRPAEPVGPGPPGLLATHSHDRGSPRAGTGGGGPRLGASVHPDGGPRHRPLHRIGCRLLRHRLGPIRRRLPLPGTAPPSSA
ncbi:hypothetical protein GCM10010278_77910 [Streptomyces melanogenes]|nr:hypothetical protein GCM10010278_77910 [Streptomyces melanogenes]